MKKLAWHFVSETLKDGSPIPADGEWLEHSGPIQMCKSGLHASFDPFDALKYAPGPILCRVEVEDVRERESDKLVCSRRRIIARRDVTDELHLFARQCALDVIHLWDAPEIVKQYLDTGNENIRAAARDAARAAARDAAWAALDAARAAAWAARGAARAAAWAARDAARDAAWAARDAAWDAAWDARDARDAARDAWDAQRARFNTLINNTFGIEQ